MKEGVVDCALGGNIEGQGRRSMEIMIDYLIFGRKPEREMDFSEIKVMFKESLCE